MKLKALFICLLTLPIFFSCDKEEIFEVEFLLVNQTDEKIRIEYDFVEEGCEAPEANCDRREIADIVPPGGGQPLFIRDQVYNEFEISNLFDRFQIVRVADDATSPTNVWTSDNLF